MGLPIIGDLIDGVTDIISEVIPDADKKMEIKLELEKLRDQANARVHEEMLGQIATNKTEASHRSIFVAGWRPFIGWTSGVGVAWTFIVSPLAEWVSRLFGWAGTMPVIDASQLMTLVLAMLGVAGLRSYDKQAGTSNDAPMLAPKEEKKKKKKILGITLPFADLPEDAPWTK